MKTQIKHRYTGAVLFDCEVPDAVASGLAVRHALEQAVLVKANLSSADLSSADLRSADLSSADLRSADLSSADLSSANLRSANLSYANLSSANLSYANLSYANLRYADLRSANLSYANLSYANLRSANLRSANLSYANLSYADLRSANLSSADLCEGRKLVGERPFMSIGPIGSRNSYMQAWITDKGPMIRAGCFFDTRDQFELKLAEDHGDNNHGQEYTAALVLIDKHIELWTPKTVEVQS